MRTDETATVEESVLIARPIEQVFAFYTDFRHLPEFLGDVMQVDVLDARRSLWTIRGPLGLGLRMHVVITSLHPNGLIAYRTDGAAPTRWEIHFARAGTAATTLVRETMTLPGGQLAAAALAALGKPPAHEVRANLARLKEVMETGRVTTLDFAVGGKFRSASDRGWRRAGEPKA
jgi:uncharacterized membrane protein